MKDRGMIDLLDCMVELRNVHKQFGRQTVVEQLSLDIRRGEFITLLGPSGCGKTTTLRMIAGFEQPTSGEIYLDGESVQGQPAYERNVNTVFQNYALFPHLNVYENVAFGLRIKKVAKAETDRRVKEVLQMVQLQEYIHRKPDELSGGQKQRVAIARALVNNPKVLLLDEPLGALDQKLRKQMQMELKHLQKQLGITFIFVTHDQEEALTMSDRIAVMNNGRMEQIGTPDQIYDSPQTRFVAEFIGETNLLTGKVIKVEDNQVMIEAEGTTFLSAKRFPASRNEAVTLSIRPERTSLSLQRTDDGRQIQLAARFVERTYIGLLTKTTLLLPGGSHFVAHEKTDKLLPVQPGDELFVSWDPEHMVVLNQ
jgi:spermidine/putrescine transport system ATP-binding protein